jgi:hypothetical protein
MAGAHAHKDIAATNKTKIKVLWSDWPPCYALRNISALWPGPHAWGFLF